MFTKLLNSREKLENTSLLKEDSLALYFKDIRKIKLLSLEQERELVEGIFQDRANGTLRNNLAQRNFRLVVKEARKFNRIKHLSLIDLIQEGNIGLLQAINRFDPRFNVRFSTYAVWWIRQAIFKAIADQDRAIRVPLNKLNDIKRMNKIESIYCNDGNSGVSSRANVAEKMHISLKELAVLVALNSEEIVSLDKPYCQGEDADPLYMQIADREPPAFEQDLDYLEFQAQLKVILKTVLVEREFTIICMRFGLPPYQREHTLEEAGTVFNLTRERIRQIEEVALAKLNKVQALEAFRN